MCNAEEKRTEVGQISSASKRESKRGSKRKPFCRLPAELHVMMSVPISGAAPAQNAYLRQGSTNKEAQLTCAGGCHGQA
ncbi:uncharacterized protein N7515_002005 [Penicillium bovifimosum]|uniref:Uncharacterized protein n=1 Tax=Penicillium bovifimosum TaxID=126998 RepID=A0A9W9HAY9_9EURO|nr:uncharacterized protein N7515_002005 [Penicillium bovifimosum]KAJ5143218.1 hypothetical protein N7515_002005 [Penicillium bovifimosum]